MMTANMSLNAFHGMQFKTATFKAIKYSVLGAMVAAPLIAGVLEAATSASMTSIYTATQTNVGGGGKVAGYIGGLFALYTAAYLGKWTSALSMGAGIIGAANWSSFNDAIWGALI